MSPPAALMPLRVRCRRSRPMAEIIERQAQDIERLTGDRAQAVEHARQLETVLRDPAVQKSVLKVLHPDAHPDADDRERRALTERFQKAAAVFDRIEGS